MDFNFILLFVHESITEGRVALGSDDPIIQGLILSMFAVTGFGIILNLFNAGVRKKMVDQVKHPNAA